MRGDERMKRLTHHENRFVHTVSKWIQPMSEVNCVAHVISTRKSHSTDGRMKLIIRSIV